jgi:hypothetical protein
MKKYSEIISVILAVMLAFPISFVRANDCDIDGNTWEAWEKCDNQVVKIAGRISEFPMQHPTGLHNAFNPHTKAFETKMENYMDYKGAQLVLTSKEAITCKGRIEVEGIVDLIDLGGQEGTKQGYKNIWIKVIHFECYE